MAIDTEPVSPHLAARGSKPGRANRARRRWRFGGPEGNEILTSAAAVVLVGLLVAEGITIVHMRRASLG